MPSLMQAITAPVLEIPSWVFRCLQRHAGTGGMSYSYCNHQAQLDKSFFFRKENITPNMSTLIALAQILTFKGYLGMTRWPNSTVCQVKGMQTQMFKLRVYHTKTLVIMFLVQYLSATKTNRQIELINRFLSLRNHAALRTKSGSGWSFQVDPFK